MRKQQIVLSTGPIMVLSSALATQPDGSPYPADCYQDTPDSEGIYQAKLTDEELATREKAASEREWRDGLMTPVSNKINILFDKKLPYEDWSLYRDAMRDYPATVDFPNGIRPQSPDGTLNG